MGSWFPNCQGELFPAVMAMDPYPNQFAAEGWVDLDAALRDPEDPHRMQEGMHLGDGVHPNWPGGAKMAQAVADTLFQSI